MPDIDHAQRAINRVIWQYRKDFNFDPTDFETSDGSLLETSDGGVFATSEVERTAFQEWMRILPVIVQEKIEKPTHVIRDILDIDAREGAQLDIIGRIVQQPRRGQSDANYRILIKSKIYKNASDALVDSIIRAVEVITGSGSVRMDDGQDGSFRIIFDSTLSDDLVMLLSTFEIVPRPQGIEFDGFAANSTDTPLRLDGVNETGDKDLNGLAELNHSEGGTLAELYGVD